MPFFVIDEHENFTSWPEDGDKPESFKSEKAAKRRAVQLAKNNPGSSFLIVQDIARVRTPVSDPVVESTI